MLRVLRDVNVRNRGILVGLLLIFGGCQAPDPSIELLESELRWMEDQVYFLDRQLDQTCSQLASCQRNNAALRQQLSAAPTPSIGNASGVSPRGTERATRPPLGQRPAIDAGGESFEPVPPAAHPPLVKPAPDTPTIRDDELEIPEIELGPEATPSSPSTPAPEEPTESDRSGSSAAQPPGDVDVSVARIVLNSRLTGGYDSDRHTGDEGLLLVVEPQNVRGQYVPIPGDLEIQVVDPHAAASRREVARWNFDASETVPFLKKTLLGQGVHLQLPWPNQPPQSPRLQLTVRYRTLAGETLTAQREVRVDPIAQQNENSPTRDSATAVTQSSPPHMSPAQPLQTILKRSAVELHQLLPDALQHPPQGPQFVRSGRPLWEPMRATAAEDDPTQRTGRGNGAADSIATPRRWSPRR